jgi:hypothetical protein
MGCSVGVGVRVALGTSVAVGEGEAVGEGVLEGMEISRCGVPVGSRRLMLDRPAGWESPLTGPGRVQAAANVTRIRNSKQREEIERSLGMENTNKNRIIAAGGVELV